MNRVHFFIFALILTSFLVAPVAQSWGDVYGIPQQKTLYDTKSKTGADILTTLSNPYGSSLIETSGSHGRSYFRFRYSYHNGYKGGLRGYSKGYYVKRHGPKHHHKGYLALLFFDIFPGLPI